jgi:hypothetical protein
MVKYCLNNTDLNVFFAKSGIIIRYVTKIHTVDLNVH